LKNNPEGRAFFDDHQTGMRGFGLLKVYRPAVGGIRPERSPSEMVGWEPHTSIEVSPIDALLSGESGSVLWHLLWWAINRFAGAMYVL
jgi:hypothetical protein